MKLCMPKACSWTRIQPCFQSAILESEPENHTMRKLRHRISLKIFRWAIATIVTLSTLNPQLSTLFAQGTDFTYNGQLNDGGSPATGLYDLQFTLLSVLSGPGTVA